MGVSYYYGGPLLPSGLTVYAAMVLSVDVDVLRNDNLPREVRQRGGQFKQPNTGRKYLGRRNVA